MVHPRLGELRGHSTRCGGARWEDVVASARGDSVGQLETRELRACVVLETVRLT